MKLFSFIALILFGTSVMATPVDPADSSGTGDITQAVATAIRSGNAVALAAYFNPTIDLTVPGTEGTYSKSQAELIVKGFFTANPPKSFVIQHQGNSGELTQFCIGTLETESTKFRTYFLIKIIDGVSLITKLQFEEE
jgi:hypothetical protein